MELVDSYVYDVCVVLTEECQDLRVDSPVTASQSTSNVMRDCYRRFVLDLTLSHAALKMLPESIQCLREPSNTLYLCFVVIGFPVTELPVETDDLGSTVDVAFWWFTDFECSWISTIPSSGSVGIGIGKLVCQCLVEASSRCAD